MPLSPGTLLGRYEILLPLGAGGMGEVYKARDTRLGRIVAVKVIPAHAAANPDAVRRFEREARAISAIDHPHICALYDVGRHDGVEFLVMQYLEGETLAARLERGALPLEAAVAHAVAIADALDRAHAAGIVHRDLKPANILLTPDGAKLLDFGIARMLGTSLPDALTATRGGEPITAPGNVLGTLPYMAPEQLAGDEADARSDIFAFGVILYEMVSGRRPFDGRTPAALVDAILHRQPEPLAHKREVPPWYDAIVRRCLAKRPQERWATAGLVGSALSEATAATLDRPRDTGNRRRHLTTPRGIVLLCAAGALVLAATWAIGTRIPGIGPRAGEPIGGRSGPPPRPVNPPRATDAVVPLHLSMPLPAGLHIPPLGPELAVAPDGRRVVFRARTADGTLVLFLRSLDSMDVKPLPGTGNGRHPFWAPDGTAIGFFDDRKLKTMDLAGGAIQVLCDAPAARGGSWSTDRTILFAPQSGSAGIHRVADTGGTPERVTTIDAARGQLAHTWPVFLADGRRFLYTITGASTGETGTYLHSSNGSPDVRVLAAASNIAYASGHLLFVTGGTLMTVAFDPDRGLTSGEPRALAAGMYTSASHAEFSASDAVLAFWRTARGAGRLTMTDRAGTIVQTVSTATPIRDPALSPDERFVAFSAPGENGAGSDLWLLEWARGSRRRITFDPASEYYPLWSPNSRRLVFASNREGGMKLYLKDLAGETDRLLLESSDEVYPTDWSKDGRYIIYEKRDAQSRTRDLWALALAGGDIKALAATAADERQGRLSPDGRWLAYSANDSGSWEIYVRAFHDPSRLWQVSIDGGVQPEWSRAGNELYYINDARELAVVRRAAGADFDFAPPTRLFPIDLANRRPRSLYSVTADGRHFLFSTQPPGDEELVGVITNWSVVDARR